MGTLQLTKISRSSPSIEKTLLIGLGLIFFSNSLAQKVSEIVSTSSFISEVNAENFLYVLGLSSILSLSISLIQSSIVDRIDRLNLLRVVSFTLGILFLILRILYIFNIPSWLIHGSFYIISEQQFTFFPLVFWLVASDFIDRQNARRIFPKLSAVGFTGNLIGIGLAALVSSLSGLLTVSSQNFLTLDAGIYAAIYFGLSYMVKRRRGSMPSSIKESDLISYSENHQYPKISYQAIKRSSPAIHPLAIAIVASIVVEVIIEYKFFLFSSHAFRSSNSYQFFLSMFMLARTIAYVGIQKYITEKVIYRLSLKKSFFILPVSSLLGIISFGLVPNIWGAVAGFSFQKLPQYSIDETARKSLLSSFPKTIRGRVSILMDSYSIAGGTILGCLLIASCNILSSWFGLSGHTQVLSTLLGVVLSITAIYSIHKMQHQFERSFPERRAPRSRETLSAEWKSETSTSSGDLTLMTSQSRRVRKSRSSSQDRKASQKT